MILQGKKSVINLLLYKIICHKMTCLEFYRLIDYSHNSKVVIIICQSVLNTMEKMRENHTKDPTERMCESSSTLNRPAKMMATIPTQTCE